MIIKVNCIYLNEFKEQIKNFIKKFTQMLSTCCPLNGGIERAVTAGVVSVTVAASVTIKLLLNVF